VNALVIDASIAVKRVVEEDGGRGTIASQRSEADRAAVRSEA
jgi:hypothetical protein